MKYMQFHFIRARIDEDRGLGKDQNIFNLRSKAA